MAIENINSVQPVVNNTVEEVKQEEEVYNVPQQKGSSKDVLAVLASLAAIGAAGIAIYKHKNAKKAVEEAVKKVEEEAQKKIDAAEEKAKKAADDVEKRIQEAVDKAKKEFKTDKDKPATDTPTPKSESETADKPSFVSRFKNLFKRKPKTTKAPVSGATKKPSVWTRFKNLFKTKTKTTTSRSKTPGRKGIFRPVTPRVPGEKPAVTPTPTGVTGEKKPSFKDRIKNLFTKKDKKAKGHSDDTEPKVTPATGTPKPAATGTGAPTPKPATTTGTPKPAATTEAPVTTPKPEAKPATAPVATEEETIEAIAEEEQTSLWARFKNIFRRKQKPEAPQAEPKPAATGTPTPTPKPTAATGAPKPAATTGTPKPATGTAEPKPVVTEAPVITPKPEVKPAPASAQVAAGKAETTVIEGLPDVTTMSEQELVANYNGLKKVVQGLPAMDPNSQRFLEIQGELFNHRGYRFLNGQFVKPIAKKPEPKPYEVFKGVKMPDVTTISEENLVAEYNALKNIVKGLPAGDATSQRFMEIQGELFNHRGYRFQNGQLVKTAAPKPELKVEKTPEIAKYVAEKEAQLNGNIRVSIPKKNTNYEHKQIQKQYDEMVRELEAQERVANWQANARDIVAKKEAELNGRISINVPKKSTNFEHKQLQKEYEEVLGIKAQKPAAPKAEPKAADVKPAEIKPAVKPSVSLVDRAQAEFKGLTEEEALQIEYANCRYCVEDLFRFMDLKQAPYKARMAEIEAELQKLGKEVNTSILNDEVMKVRIQTVNQRTVVADGIEFLADRKEEFAEATAKLYDAGIDGVTQTPAEMNLQGTYLYYKRMDKEYGFYADNLKRAIAALEEKGFKPFEAVTEQDKVIAEYMEAYHFKVLSESGLNRKQKELAYLEEQLSELLLKEGSKKK